MTFNSLINPFFGSDHYSSSQKCSSRAPWPCKDKPPSLFSHLSAVKSEIGNPVVKGDHHADSQILPFFCSGCKPIWDMGRIFRDNGILPL